ncbi:MAG: multidrug ABC transporter ATP-binding protein [Rhodobacterales bacterium]|nr:MAG: multidrug ABC transporter ATP-binding protein [Rhodobacterales bacterium]
MGTIVRIADVRKTYEGGFDALKGINIDIQEGEVLALLGPNGAGKTTLISIICGIARLTSGKIKVGGHDIVTDARAARKMIGLVPQELYVENFEKVIDTLKFSQGLFGHKNTPGFLEKILKDLSLWDKRNEKVMNLSGGMKRRLMIAKALAHEPRVLFLDEPTAGVDVELRRDMWEVMRRLKESGVTIILTTHYIEEAEAMADRIGVINHGELLLLEETSTLMRRMGHKSLTLELAEEVTRVPDSLAARGVRRGRKANELIYEYDAAANQTGITDLLADLRAAGLHMTDLNTHQSSLEDIFVSLVSEEKP